MDEYPEDCPTRMAWGLGSGFLAGSLLGAISSNWSDVPMVIRNKTWPAFVRTGSVMLSSGTTLGLVGLTFSTVDCFSETVRGKKDWKNGAIGGAASGLIFGLRVGRLQTAVKAAALLAAGSALVDASGRKLSGQRIPDGATPPRRMEGRAISCSGVRPTCWQSLVRTPIRSRWISKRKKWRRKASGDEFSSDLDGQADSFVGRTSKSPSKADRSRRLDEIESLANLIPDPMKDESLLDPVDPNVEGFDDSLFPNTEALQSWDGIDGASTPLGGCALSSLPLGAVDDMEGVAASSTGEGLPTYRATSRSAGRVPGLPSPSYDDKFDRSPASGKTNGFVMAPMTMSTQEPSLLSAEQQALEDLLMERAIDDAMRLHHERNEISHSRYATAIRFGELLEAVELDDVRRGSIPLLEGTGQKYPTWIRAADVLHKEIPEINAETEALEAAATAAELERVKDAIYEEVEKAARLLAEVDPQAGIATEDFISDDQTSLEELFGDDEGGTLLPGADVLAWDFELGDSAEELAASALASMKMESGQDDIVAVVARKLAPEWDAAAAAGRAERNFSTDDYKMKRGGETASEIVNESTGAATGSELEESSNDMEEDDENEEARVGKDIDKRQDEDEEFGGEDIEDIKEIYTMTDDEDGDYHALGFLEGALSEDDGGDSGRGKY